MRVRTSTDQSIESFALWLGSLFTTTEVCITVGHSSPAPLFPHSRTRAWDTWSPPLDGHSTLSQLRIMASDLDMVIVIGATSHSKNWPSLGWMSRLDDVSTTTSSAKIRGKAGDKGQSAENTHLCKWHMTTSCALHSPKAFPQRNEGDMIVSLLQLHKALVDPLDKLPYALKPSHKSLELVHRAAPYELIWASVLLTTHCLCSLYLSRQLLFPLAPHRCLFWIDKWLKTSMGKCLTSIKETQRVYWNMLPNRRGSRILTIRSPSDINKRHQ